mmetsp:Transcript_46243/g.121242  ORF Transcript_46243/g.121242 Transcript_46243/m.121242 type:complete len:573 (+) Transcript_46243:376-2094(+)
MSCSTAGRSLRSGSVRRDTRCAYAHLERLESRSVSSLVNRATLSCLPPCFSCAWLTHTLARIDSWIHRQKDIFFAKLSVLEHLRCTAELRLPASWSSEAKLQEMHRIVRLLRLEKALRTVVGTGVERGLSGGEQKRLNIATELLARPRLLFMDEPFTGLDSSLAMATLGALRQVAAAEGVAVMITVHQPSSPMWVAFDSLLLMAPGGRVAFFGARDDAAQHFASTLGLPCPADWSPADHYIEIVTADASRVKATDAWAARTPLALPAVDAPLPTRPRPPHAVAVRALLRRQLVQVRRNLLKPMEWILTGLLAAVFGVLWWQVGAHRDESSHQSDYISIIFFFIAQWSWAPLFQVIGSFPDERDVLTRELASDSYPIGAWYVAKLMAEVPLSWLLPALFFAISYPLAALPAGQVTPLFGIVLLNTEVATSLGALISALVFDRDQATTLAIVYMVFVMCAGGYFINLAHMPLWIASMRYVSFWYYSLGLFVAFALPTAADRAAWPTTAGGGEGSGSGSGSGDVEGPPTLERYSFSTWSWEGEWYYDVLVLLGFALLHRVGAYLALITSKKLRFS